MPLGKLHETTLDLDREQIEKLLEADYNRNVGRMFASGVNIHQ